MHDTVNNGNHCGERYDLALLRSNHLRNIEINKLLTLNRQSTVSLTMHSGGVGLFVGSCMLISSCTSHLRRTIVSWH